ncbi:MAG TPA: hypothetical protein GX511_00280 [Firmicutes bacterium]|nr:hypothetical protein [Bacillota bacterium]
MGVGGRYETEDVSQIIIQLLATHPAIAAVDTHLPDKLRLAFFIQGSVPPVERQAFMDETQTSWRLLGELLPGAAPDLNIEWLAAGALTALWISINGIPKRSAVGLLIALLKRQFGARLVEDDGQPGRAEWGQSEGMNRLFAGNTGRSIVAFRAEGTLRIYRYR